MSNLRKAAEMALPLLVAYQDYTGDSRIANECGEIIAALRQALAQDEQENEAYGYAKRLAQAIWEKHYKEESPDWKPKNDVLGVLTQIDNMTCGLEKAQPEQEPVAWMFEGNKPIKVYAAPSSKPWVSLTDEEINQAANNAGFGHINIAREIEAKLKEKNT